MPSRAVLAIGLLAALAALLVPALATAAKPAIRVGGQSALGESKFAIVGSDRSLAGRRFTVRNGSKVVLRGRLERAAGRPARGEGFSAGPLQSNFSTYEDRRADYVTSEPAIDYTAASILLMAALEGRC